MFRHLFKPSCRSSSPDCLRACQLEVYLIYTSQSSSKLKLALFQGIDFYTSLTHACFVKLFQDLFRSTLDPVEKGPRDSKIDNSKIHKIILVSGSTRIPRIVKLVSESPVASPFPVTPLRSSFFSESFPSPFPQYRDCWGIMTAVIKRNTTVPTKKETEFFPLTVNRPGVLIQLYEGERLHHGQQLAPKV
jgi:heat shock protein 1/8